MIISAKEIAEITRLLDESHFSELRLEVGDFRLRISRGGSSASWGDTAEDVTDHAADIARPATELQPAAAIAGPAAGEVDVPAPLLGNFYEAPRPGDPPFVKPGDRVSKETVIGIIEVMKLMNPVRSGVAGTVVAMLAENGKPVEQGQGLLRIRLD